MRRSRLSLAAALAVASSAVLVGVPSVADAAPKPSRRPGPAARDERLPRPDLAHHRWRQPADHRRRARTACTARTVDGQGRRRRHRGRRRGQRRRHRRAAAGDFRAGRGPAASYFVGAGDLISASAVRVQRLQGRADHRGRSTPWAWTSRPSATTSSTAARRSCAASRRRPTAPSPTTSTACQGVVAGVDRLLRRAGEHAFDGADFPYLAANVVSKATGQPMLPPYQVFDIAGGQKVALIGVVTETTPDASSRRTASPTSSSSTRPTRSTVRAELPGAGRPGHRRADARGRPVTTARAALDPNGCDDLTGADPRHQQPDRHAGRPHRQRAHATSAYNCLLPVPGGPAAAGHPGRLLRPPGHRHPADPRPARPATSTAPHLRARPTCR